MTPKQRADRLALVAGLLLAVVAFAGIVLLLSPTFGPDRNPDFAADVPPGGSVIYKSTFSQDGYAARIVRLGADTCVVEKYVTSRWAFVSSQSCSGIAAP